MTRKHYRKIADIIRVHTENATPEELAVAASIAVNLTDVLRDDNPNFDIERFLVACGL